MTKDKKREGNGSEYCAPTPVSSERLGSLFERMRLLGEKLGRAARVTSPDEGKRGGDDGQ